MGVAVVSVLEHVPSVCVCVCVYRDGRMIELSVDSAVPVTVLSSPGATHLDTDGYLWLGLFPRLSVISFIVANRIDRDRSIIRKQSSLPDIWLVKRCLVVGLVVVVVVL